SLTPPPPAEIYALSLHDALPISRHRAARTVLVRRARMTAASTARTDALRALTIPSELLPSDGRFGSGPSRVRDAQMEALSSVSRSEEHTSELQSRENLVCRLLLE